MADWGHFEKIAAKNVWVRYLINHWLDHIQIWCGGSTIFFLLALIVL